MREFKLGKPTRAAYGEALLKLGEEIEEIVVLDADLSKSTHTYLFAERFPERFFNFGIAEANMVGAAAGLARCGKIPFCSSFACFMVNKAYEQIKISVAGSNLSVKFVSSHGGISVGEDGFTQQSIEDIALMCTFPGFTVIAPCDEVYTQWVIREVAKREGPVYVRTQRPKAPIIYENGNNFNWGKYIKLEDGEDVAIFTYGLTVAECLKAHDLLKEKGIKALIFDAPFIKPLDEETLLRVAKEVGKIVVVEEHLKDGGLGSRIASFLSERNPVPIKIIAIENTYGESGKPDELFDKFGISYKRIFEKLIDFVKKT